MSEKVKRKRPFLVLFIISTSLLVASVLFSLLLIVSLQAKNRALYKFHIPHAFNVEHYRPEITAEPELASYPPDTDKITFKITDPTGLGFWMESYYFVEKDSLPWLFNVWPTHTFLGYERDLVVYIPGPKAPPSADGGPVSVDFSVDLSKWKVRPTSGSYSLYVIIHVPIEGQGYDLYLLCCPFVIS